MRGRQVFMDSLVAHGADAVFGNPGTTENPLLDSLIDYPQIEYYVALHEGVAVCAASSYAQASRKTAIANLHVAPGLGNAIGMIYGSLKASTPLIVTAGSQDTRMRLRAPLLSHDLVAMAAPVTKWSVEPRSADEISPVMRRAFKIANEPPAGPVFVALPVDVMEQETNLAAETAGDLYHASRPSDVGVQKLASLLLASRSPVILAGDDIATQGANVVLTELVELTGAAVYVEFLRAQQAIAQSHANLRGRIPLETASIHKLLSDHDLVLMIGGPFFEEVWYDPVDCIPGSTITTQIESSEERLARNFPLAAGLVGNIPVALKELRDAIAIGADAQYQRQSAGRNEAFRATKAKEAEAFSSYLNAHADSEPMAPVIALHEIAGALPDNAIIVDEAVTAMHDLAKVFTLEQAGDFYAGRGGGIGQGIAGALGIAVAHPDRLVVALSGDGSAMYSIQALWTAAHHKLNILFVILSNREYRILKHNLDTYRQRFDVPADRPYPHMDLHEPTLGFADMARGMGVNAVEVTRPDDLRAALKQALAARGPFLLDVVVAGK